MGKGAPEDFIEKLEGVANSHHDQLVVDVIRAYFFGARFIVEVSLWSILFQSGAKKIFRFHCRLLQHPEQLLA